MIDETPTLRSKVAEAKSRDSGNTVLMKDFPGGALILTGANSGPGLRSMPIRFLMMDEVDAYPSDVDGEGDPCVVAEKRTDTFSRRKIFRCSSPKLKATSRIERFYEASDQRRYHVPCPHCEHEQWLKWDGIRWETAKVWEVTRADDGEIVEVAADTEGATERDTGDVVRAWYECESCQGEILEHHKTKMLEAGRWIAARPNANRNPGFHLSALYSPWVSFSQLAGEWLLAQDNRAALEDFLNQRLAEPFEEIATAHDEPTIRRHADGALPTGVVPSWATAVFTTVDVQKDWFALCIRAWGWGLKSVLLWYGQCRTFEEV
jgi:phage terminase large subunit GpA-like protein